MMLQDWHERFPTRIASMAKSLQQVVPSHLCDSDLFAFSEIKATGEVNAEGDIAFDPPSIQSTSSSLDSIHVVEVN